MIISCGFLFLPNQKFGEVKPSTSKIISGWNVTKELDFSKRLRSNSSKISLGWKLLQRWDFTKELGPYWTTSNLSPFAQIQKSHLLLSGPQNTLIQKNPIQNLKPGYSYMIVAKLKTNYPLRARLGFYSPSQKKWFAQYKIRNTQWAIVKSILSLEPTSKIAYPSQIFPAITHLSQYEITQIQWIEIWTFQKPAIHDHKSKRLDFLYPIILPPEVTFLNNIIGVKAGFPFISSQLKIFEENSITIPYFSLVHSINLSQQVFYLESEIGFFQSKRTIRVPLESENENLTLFSQDKIMELSSLNFPLITQAVYHLHAFKGSRISALNTFTISPKIGLGLMFVFHNQLELEAKLSNQYQLHYLLLKAGLDISFGISDHWIIQLSNTLLFLIPFESEIPNFSRLKVLGSGKNTSGYIYIPTLSIQYRF